MTVDTTLQKATVYFTFIVGILIIGMSLYTAYSFTRISPKPPSLVTSSQRSNDTIKAEIANYTSLVTAIQTSKEFYFKVVVTDSLAMIFKLLLTTVLTFIFGKPIAEAIAVRLGK